MQIALLISRIFSRHGSFFTACFGVGRSTFQVAMRIRSSGKVDSVS